VAIDPSSAAFRVEATAGEGGGKTLKLAGVVDEHADLRFFNDLHGDVKLSMRGVRRINSYGVRAWIDAIRKVPADCQLEIIECPPPVVDQMNMVAGFLGRGKVTSFYAPMLCDHCTHEMDQLFTVEACREAGGKLPPLTCPRCGKPMGVDDIEDQYLLFVRET
jgi:eukaryotic-like serine/threonine-protein kinase